MNELMYSIIVFLNNSLMKKIIFSIFFVLIFANSFSQIDSLRIKMESYLQLSQKGEDEPDILDFFLNLEDEKLDTVIYHAKNYIWEAKKAHNIDSYINGVNFITNLLHSKSSYTEEINILSVAIKYIDNDKNNELVKAKFLYQLGETSRAIGQFESGIEYLSEAENIYMKNNKQLKIAKIYNRKAAIILELSADAEKIFEYTDKSIKIAKEYNDYELIANNLEIKGVLYDKKEKYEKAIGYFLEVINIFEKNNEEPFDNVYINLCITYYRMGNYKESVKYGEKIISKVIRSNNLPQRLMLCDFMSFSYFKIGDYYNAYDCLRISYGAHVYIFREKQDAKIAELNKKYETEKKEVEIENQKNIIKYSELKLNQKNKQNIALLGGIILTISFLLLLFLQKIKTNKLNKQLKQKNIQLLKLSSFKDSMTSMLVHDLKNPLNIILGTTQNRRNGEQNQKIHNSASKMLFHISNLLDVNKYENSLMILKQEEISIQNLINSVFNEIEFALKSKNIQFHTKISINYDLFVDKNIAERIFINLLTNAIKFTPQNGKITISVKPKNNKLLYFFVADTGKGIPDLMHEFVFKKYNQIDSDIKGQSSGLGLAFCKIAVETHGGTIKIKKNKEDGAEFILSLPYFSNKNEKNLLEKKNIEMPENNLKFNLDKTEILQIKPYIKELKDLDVFCITDVKEVIIKINSLNISKLNLFIYKIELSIETCNQDLYESVIEKIAGCYLC